MQSQIIREKIFDAITALNAVTENSDCIIDLDRLPVEQMQSVLDDLASAKAHLAQAYESILVSVHLERT